MKRSTGKDCCLSIARRGDSTCCDSLIVSPRGLVRNVPLHWRLWRSRIGADGDEYDGDARAGVSARVAAGSLKLGSAARLMEVSYRQAKRLYRRYRGEGAKGLKHRSAGRASNRATDARTQRRVLALIREKYSGGGRALRADARRRASGE
jgi:hypothetical protein